MVADGPREEAGEVRNLSSRGAIGAPAASLPATSAMAPGRSASSWTLFRHPELLGAVGVDHVAGQPELERARRPMRRGSR